MVETIRLESGHTLTGIGGSNPSLSAMFSSTCENCDPLCNPLVWFAQGQRHSDNFGVRLRHFVRYHIPVQIHGRADISVSH